MKKILLLVMCLLLSSCGSGTVNKNDVEIDESTAEVTAVPTASPTADPVEAVVANMTIEEKVWQMFLTAPEDIIDADSVTTAGDMTKAALESCPVGGVIMFGNNIKERSQIIDLLRGMQSYSKIPLFTAVDEEGGRVARLGKADVGVTKFPPMAEVGARGNTDEAAQIGATLGKELREIGFNVDFAPVADIITVENNDDIGDRSFGEDPQLVAGMVAAEVKAMSDNGLIATLKHFPSNGSTETNTHYGSGVCTRTLDELRANEFIPFKAGIDAGADMVMVAHMAVPDITGDETPSTLSSVVIKDLLRNELGFGGVVVSDALNMGAITSQYTPLEAAMKAIDAGADILLMSPDVRNTATGIINAVYAGDITEERINESVDRILKLKLKRGIM